MSSATLSGEPSVSVALECTTSIAHHQLDGHRRRISREFRSHLHSSSALSFNNIPFHDIHFHEFTRQKARIICRPGDVRNVTP
jgi:hypothetical protein